MKIPYLIPAAALFFIGLSGCDKHSTEIDKRIAELERKNNEAIERARDLEQQIEDQKLAAERDAIERERAQIDEERAEMERQQGQQAAEQDEALKQREEALAKREDKIDKIQENLEKKEDRLSGQEQDLTERDRDLAGREALNVEPTEQNVPVGDYGTFYDGLSTYGSWFETSDYGYVWQPAVVREVNWRPYCRGRWVCSDRGWTWVSEEPFGWATYHYGRWVIIGGRGWVWVPGSEWAPCWVSWRENDSHIGWAPLPPETMAYRGRSWDSTVDVQFGIGAGCFTFVEIRHFGSPLYRHCLPLSSNFGFYNQSTNVTYIHSQNNYVICGGPRYQRVCDRIGKPLPFYRLEVDHRPRSSRDQFAMNPLIRDGKLRISAPNMNADWNEGLRPKQVRGRIETVNVERTGTLSREITDRYRQSREESRVKADRSIAVLGGVEKFEERRSEQLQNNRREVEGKLPKEKTRETAKQTERPQPEVATREPGPKVTPPPKNPSLPDGMTRKNDVVPNLPGIGKREEAPRVKPEPQPARPPETRDGRVATGQNSGPHVVPEPPTSRKEPDSDRKQAESRGGMDRQPNPKPDVEKEDNSRKQQEQARQAQQQAEQARQAQIEAQRQRQAEQAQRKQEQERQLQEEQAKDARKQAMEEQRERARQQQQEAQNEARRQQAQEQAQEQAREQAREQRQQEESRQRQQEESRQRQQAQEQSRQREQEQSRQQQQEQARQQQRQEESRQQKQKDDDDQKKRNR